jgi:hypothetical protein
LSAAKKRDSNLLFALLSNVFENFFSQHLPALLANAAEDFCTHQQRGEILICLFDFVKYF